VRNADAKKLIFGQARQDQLTRLKQGSSSAKNASTLGESIVNYILKNNFIFKYGLHLIFMSTLFQNLAEVCKRDSGESISIAHMPFKKAYANDESRRLSREYDVHSHSGFVSSSLGSSGLETFVGHLFRAYSFVGEFCGFPWIDLGDFTVKSTGRMDYLLRLIENGFFTEQQVQGEDVFFPTEEFLKNQRIKKRI